MTVRSSGLLRLIAPKRIAVPAPRQTVSITMPPTWKLPPNSLLALSPMVAPIGRGHRGEGGQRDERLPEPGAVEYAQRRACQVK